MDYAISNIYIIYFWQNKYNINLTYYLDRFTQINKGNREIKQSVNTKDSAWAQDKNTTLSRVQT